MQDDSVSIMKNDTADMAQITAIQNTDLIENIEYTPLETVETEIEYPDFTEGYEKLNKAVDDIYTTYEANMEEAEKELLEAADIDKTIGGNITAALEVFADINILTDEEEECVYETGMNHLSNLAADFEQDTLEKKNTAKQRLGFQEGDEEPEPEPELSEGEERVYITKDDLIAQIDEQIAFMEDVQKALQGKSKRAADTVSGNDSTDEHDVTEADAAESIEQLKEFRAQVEEYYENGIRAINAIPVPTELITDAGQIIAEEIKQPIEEEIDKEAENVSNAVGGLETAINDYTTAIIETDPISCIEKETINEYMSSLGTTISDLETEIMEHDTAYMEYINEVTTTADNNVQMLQENLNTAYEQTQNNIDSTMNSFKQNRTSLNEQNVLMLGDITQKLPYTRLGNLEYTQVYDFIVQPIIAEEKTAGRTKTAPISISMRKGNPGAWIVGIIVLGIILFYIIDIVVQLIHKKNNEI